MAYKAENADDYDAQIEAKKAADLAFRQQISTPEGMAAYNNQVAQRWSDIQNHTNGYEDFGGGGFLDSLGKIIDPIMNGIIKYGPIVYGAAVGADALGLFGSGAAAAGEGAAAAGTAADAGLGSISGATAGAASAGGLGAGTAAGLGGLADAAIPTVTMTAPAASAGAGIGLGGLAAGGALGAGLAGLDFTPNPGTIPQDPHLGDLPDNIQGPDSGIDPDIPVVTVTGQKPPTSGLGGLIVPPVDYTPNPGTIPIAPIPLPVVTPSSGGTSSGGTTGLPTGVGIGDILGGLGSILGAYTGYQQNTADKDYWQNYMDQLTGMYKPGTPEATMMEQKMNAQDAAAGRNSQYGIRAQNLAAMLADQRSKIMTSPSFYAMGAASRGHYDNSLNGIFNALGSAGSSGSALSNLLGAGSSYLNNLFSPASAPTR
jgi:hypothetical protein